MAVFQKFGQESGFYRLHIHEPGGVIRFETVVKSIGQCGVGYRCAGMVYPDMNGAGANEASGTGDLVDFGNFENKQAFQNQPGGFGTRELVNGGTSFSPGEEEIHDLSDITMVPGDKADFFPGNGRGTVKGDDAAAAGKGRELFVRDPVHGEGDDLLSGFFHHGIHVHPVVIQQDFHELF